MKTHWYIASLLFFFSFLFLLLKLHLQIHLMVLYQNNLKNAVIQKHLLERGKTPITNRSANCVRSWTVERSEVTVHIEDPTKEEFYICSYMDYTWPCQNSRIVSANIFSFEEIQPRLTLSFSKIHTCWVANHSVTEHLISDAWTHSPLIWLPYNIHMCAHHSPQGISVELLLAFASVQNVSRTMYQVWSPRKTRRPRP